MQAMPLARQRRGEQAPRISRREIAWKVNDTRTRIWDVEEFVAGFYQEFNKLKKEVALLKRKYETKSKMKMKPMKVMKAMKVSKIAKVR